MLEFLGSMSGENGIEAMFSNTISLGVCVCRSCKAAVLDESSLVPSVLLVAGIVYFWDGK